jgi:hypothetical protein
MCWFITMGVPAAGASLLEQRGASRGGLGVRRAANPHVARLFPASDVRFEITDGGCSCDLYAEPSETGSTHAEQLREKYRKKGWSSAKIDRAVQASEAARVAAMTRRRETGAQLLFREVVAEQVRAFGTIRLFAHMYSGSQDEEMVTSESRARLDLSAFVISGFPADTLVEVTLAP